MKLIIFRKGDYHRYLAEFATANDRKEAAENSLVAYKAASDIAMSELSPTHPIRYIFSSFVNYITFVTLHIQTSCIMQHYKEKY